MILQESYSKDWIYGISHKNRKKRKRALGKNRVGWAAKSNTPATVIFTVPPSLRANPRAVNN